MEHYLVKEKKPLLRFVVTTGDQRNPSNAFEAATALTEVIRVMSGAETPIIAPADTAEGEQTFVIAVTGDGTDPELKLSGDAFSVSVKDGSIRMSAGNAVGLWNAVGYFASAVLGYDAHTGEEPEKKNTLPLPENLTYEFAGSPAPQPIPEVADTGAFKVKVAGSTYYEEMLSHNCYLYPENVVPCLLWTETYKTLLARAVATKHLVWNTSGECKCEPCRHQAEETGEHAYGFCHCPSCSAVAEKEGTPAGAYFHLVRDAAEHLAKIEPDAYLTIVATGITLDPPKKPLGDNVRVIVTDKLLCSSHPVSPDSCEKNSEFAKKLADWKNKCGSVWVLDFTADYFYFPSLFPNLDIARKNIAYYKQIGVDGVFMQFDEMQSELEFGSYRKAMLDRLLADPDMSDEKYEELKRAALINIYGVDAADGVREYMDAIIERARDGRCWNVRTQPRDLLPLKREDGSYDLDFARRLYRMWEKLHAHPEALAKNKLYIARMLYTMYQANQLSYSKAQLNEWMMDAIDMNDRGRAIEYIIAD